MVLRILVLRIGVLRIGVFANRRFANRRFAIRRVANRRFADRRFAKGSAVNGEECVPREASGGRGAEKSPRTCSVAVVAGKIILAKTTIGTLECTWATW